MSELADLVGSLKRAVAVPGNFATLFPLSDDTTLTLTLLDGFAEAQLDGFFTTYTSDDDGTVTETMTRAEGALVVLYAGVRILANEIRNRKSHIRYEGGGAVFEQDQAASVLVELLKEYQAQKVAVKEAIRRGKLANAFYMADQYVIRAVGPAWYGDFAYGHQGA